MLAVASLALTACATVSIYPSQSSGAASVEKTKSALQIRSQAFCDLAEAEHWVKRSPGLLQAAQSIFDGKPVEGEGAKGYAERRSLSTIAPDTAIGAIAEDARRAREELATLNAVARQALDNASVPVVRDDIATFEKSLVWAQRSHRTFAAATDSVLRLAAVSSVDADNALALLAEELDRTRKLADVLAARFAEQAAPATS
jgi:hypothetical protein